MSACFKLEKGTRQGCIVSALLFEIALEPLASAICQHPRIVGIPLGNKEINFVCSLTLCCICPILEAVLDLLDHFGHISALQVNHTKTQIYPIFLTNVLELEL